MKPRLLCLCLLAALVTMSACGGGETASTPSSPSPKPSLEAVEGLFEVTISGDFSIRYAPPNYTLKMTYIDAGGYWYYLMVGDEFGLPLVTIGFFRPSSDSLPQSGTFPLVAGPILEPGEVTASANINTDEETAEGLKISYSFEQPGGTVTLDLKDNSYSGNFEFTLRGKPFNGTDYTKSITVKGTFKDIKWEK